MSLCFFFSFEISKGLFWNRSLDKPHISCDTKEWTYFKLESLMEEKGDKLSIETGRAGFTRFWIVTGHKQALSPGSPHSQMPKLQLEGEMNGLWDIWAKE